MAARTQLIQQLEGARQELRAALEAIDPKMEICPGWTTKEMLAHIAGWDQVTIPSLHALARGIEPGAPAAGDFDLVNAEFIEGYQALSYSQMVSECERVRDELKTELAELPEERLAEPFLFPWGERGTVAELVAILAGHEEEHAKELQGLKAGRA
jgi:hypothetical protein